MSQFAISATTGIAGCVAYFKANAGFTRAFTEMRRKYLGLGTVGGMVKLSQPSQNEREALSGFLRKDYAKATEISFRLADFQKALARTRFAGIRTEDLLQAYFEEPLVPNAVSLEREQAERAAFFDRMIVSFTGTRAARWLTAAIDAKAYGFPSMIRRYSAAIADVSGEGRIGSLERDLHTVCRALNNLPVDRNAKTPLAVFAADVAADPHRLDAGTPCGRLFAEGLAYSLGVPYPHSASEREELLYAAGILIDELSNWVLCYGIRAFDEAGNEIAGWRGFHEKREPLQATLLNISAVASLRATASPPISSSQPAAATCDLDAPSVFVVENPSVFASMLYRIRLGGLADVAIVCTYGQVNLAALVLLDLLKASGHILRYSGDFDPEGLLIVQKLKDRYGNALAFWHMTAADYRAAISEKTAASKRLRQLDGIRDPALRITADEILKTRRCGYQELILADLLHDLKS